MTYEEYAALPGINWSTLKHMGESPMHYRHAADNPRSGPKTSAMEFGSLTHVLVFEPDTFDAAYAVWDGGRKGTNAHKAFVAENEGRAIIDAEDLVEARAIAAAVRSHPLTSRYLTPVTLHEHTVQWTDPASGLPCKARLDWAYPPEGVLLDLKTARSATKHGFSRQAATLRYGGQMAHYAAACTHGLGWTPKRALFVVVESAAPHDIAVFEMDEESFAYCQETVAAYLARVKACTESGAWPGRYDSIETIEIPRWMDGGDDDVEVTYDTETF